MFTVDAMLFDFDGTVVTLHIDFPLMRQRVNEAIAAFGVPLHLLTAPFSWERIEQATGWLKGLDEAKAQALERAAKAIILGMEEEAAKIAAPPPDVLPTLWALRAQGIKVGLVTRNSMNAVQTVLCRHPLPFDTVATRDHVCRLKPNPEHLLFALRQLGISTLTCQAPLANRQSLFAAFVGDHPTDMQVALRSGMVPIGIGHDEPSAIALRRAGAFVVVRRLGELPHWIRRAGGKGHRVA